MRRPGAGMGRHLGGGRIPTDGSKAIMNWATGGTFTRASAATTRAENDSVLYRYASGERRFEAGRLLVEAAATDQARYSEQLDNAAWTKTNCTITTNTHAAPDGSLTADTLTTTSDGAATSVAITSVGTPASASSFQAWVRTDGAPFTGSYSYAGTATASADFTVTSTWQRIGDSISTTSAPVLTIRPHAGAGSGVAGRTMQVWGGYVQSSLNTGSYFTIEGSSITRAADSLTYAAGTWDTRLATTNYQFQYTPAHPSTATMSIGDFLSFGGSNDTVRISSADSIQVIVGGVATATSGSLVWSRDSILTITVRPTTGVCTVSGATSGNGNFGVTPWAWPTAVTLRVGGRVSGTNEIGGGISNPYPV